MTDVAKAELSADVCGIVMPISPIDGCGKEHWSEVLSIISEAIETAGFDPCLVSNGDDVGIIQKRIIKNLYDNPIVVCDVSGKNPNVMFELGIRLAFDKPTIIIKDDQTSYSFDTSPIEHLEYPRDLRYAKIGEFKQELAHKIIATHRKATTDANYTTFLKNFGEFKVPKLDEKEAPAQEIILDEIRSLRASMRKLERNSGRNRSVAVSGEVDVCLGRAGGYDLNETIDSVVSLPNISSAEVRHLGNSHYHVLAKLEPGSEVDQAAYVRMIVDAALKTRPAKDLADVAATRAQRVEDRQG